MENENKEGTVHAGGPTGKRRSSQKDKLQLVYSDVLNLYKVKKKLLPTDVHRLGHKVSVSRPAKEHTFLTDVADVRTMEHGLLQLLNDFHSGKLQAFGNTATFNKMDAIRVQQEQLAKQHFEMDLIPRHTSNRLSSEESRKENNEKMAKLVEQLHSLSVSVQTLQTDASKQDSHTKDELI